MARAAGLLDPELLLRTADFSFVAGADEAGRGACAGPLVAAAVILGDSQIPGLADSKKLSSKRREELNEVIISQAQAWAVVRIESVECDTLGIQQANLSALRRALLRLQPVPDFSITDGFAVPGLPFPNIGLWKGDQVVPCVSAASIVAKVARDRIMQQYHVDYPQYGFDVHKGYCTALHQERLDILGPCPIHRLSYANVR